jgi:ethanolamine utilization protein EutN
VKPGAASIVDPAIIMKFAQVIGNIVSTQKDKNLRGISLLVLQPLSSSLEPEGRPYIAADALGNAGQGDIVFVVFSGDAPEAFAQELCPVDASIVGLVDEDCRKELMA